MTWRLPTTDVKGSGKNKWQQKKQVYQTNVGRTEGPTDCPANDRTLVQHANVCVERVIRRTVAAAAFVVDGGIRYRRLLEEDTVQNGRIN